MDQIDSVRPYAAGRGNNAAVTLGTAIGDEVALRVVQGNGTLCDVVVTAWAMGVDPVEAVLQYAEAATGVIVDDMVVVDGADPRCA
ncbi:hypothetical protein [Nocardia sp. NPDC057030]|uniref:hypothetical protein n=1 Tax=unclassified Nocardia TaxID=2637762 RepID=UPI003630FBA7